VVFHHWRPVLAVCLVLVAAGYLLNAYHAWQGGSSNGEAINTAPLVAPPPEQAVPTAMQPTIAPTARSKDCRTLPPKYDGDVLKVTEADGALRGA